MIFKIEMNKKKLLTAYCYIFGVGNILTSFIIPIFFGDELLWYPRSIATDLMVGSLYMAMGIVMVMIAKSPENHKSFIDFLIVSNNLHAIVMVIFAQKPSHIFIDSGFIGLMGIIPLLLYPWPLRKFLTYNFRPKT